MKTLLIVPCGIETKYELKRYKERMELLIVPCGIETHEVIRFASVVCSF